MKLTLEIAKIIIDVIVIVMNFKNSFAGGWPHFVKPTTTTVNGNFWRKGQAASRSLTRTLTPKMPDRREGATFVVLNFGVAFRFSKNRKGQINNKLILFNFIFLCGHPACPLIRHPGCPLMSSRRTRFGLQSDKNDLS